MERLSPRMEGPSFPIRPLLRAPLAPADAQTGSIAPTVLWRPAGAPSASQPGREASRRCRVRRRETPFPYRRAEALHSSPRPTPRPRFRELAESRFKPEGPGAGLLGLPEPGAGRVRRPPLQHPPPATPQGRQALRPRATNGLHSQGRRIWIAGRHDSRWMKEGPGKEALPYFRILKVITSMLAKALVISLSCE